LASPGAAAPSLEVLLDGTARQIEADLAQGTTQRLPAIGMLAATLMNQQGQAARMDQVPWLMKFGENFHRWRLFAEGAQYWKGLYQLVKRLGGEGAREGAVAVAIVGAFQILSGELSPLAEHAASAAAYAHKVFGQQHVLVRDVYAKLAAPLASPASERPPLNMAPQSVRASGLVPADMDPQSRLALWVTLGFLDVANADGQVGEQEYQAWKNTMARMSLPDVSERFGSQGLMELLQRGALYELTTEFASKPQEMRGRMAATLVEFMMADGHATPGEIQAIKRITGWLGVSVQIG
jgi:uncharacterized tellurite resistance protein B-like protein